MTNTLYYGDNFDIIRDYLAAESVDLIYLDPPFNSNRNYNVLFKHESGTDSEAQIEAFEDTWHWNMTAERTYHDLIATAPDKVTRIVGALRDALGTNQMMAYLVMMSARLVELHRVLKPTGSFYLHCDPTASHYLKIVLDAIFEPINFRAEVIWKRTGAHSDSKTMGSTHDVIFFYTKSDTFTWNKQYQPYAESYIKSHYRRTTSNGRKYRTDNLTAFGLSGGGYTYEWNGVTKLWRVPESKMQALHDENRIHYTSSGTAEYIRYLDEMPGIPLQDVWDDIPPINSQAKERLGYPTQKPSALLKRIIEASSNPGDVVLDPFCGCGTAIAAAQELDRRWIGIDVTYLATSLIKFRLRDSFPDAEYDVIGEPTTLEEAQHLAAENKYDFQWWALPLVGARPLGGKAGSKKGKRGADGGIDGFINFIDDTTGKPKRIIVQVKGGKVGVSDIRDLVGTVEREKAAIGLFLSLNKPTKPMLKEAAAAGFYHSDGWGHDYPRVQIFTIEDLLDGRQPAMPPTNITFAKAPRKKGGGGIGTTDQMLLRFASQ